MHVRIARNNVFYYIYIYIFYRLNNSLYIIVTRILCLNYDCVRPTTFSIQCIHYNAMTGTTALQTRGIFVVRFARHCFIYTIIYNISDNIYFDTSHNNII